MSKIKDFIWFTKHSREYMKGQPKEFITGFWKAWKHFEASAEKDRLEL